MLPVLFLFLFLAAGPAHAQPQSVAPSSDSSGWAQSLDPQWGGHVKLRGGASLSPGGSFLTPGDDRTLWDGYSELRLKNRITPWSKATLETHYELLFSGGDTRRLSRAYGIAGDAGAGAGTPLWSTRTLDDDRRLMDLTGTIDDGDSWILTERLDRLVLTLSPSWGQVRLGRQALTWGNGLLFNPMDLFNPFAPTDIDRDYKVGDDMALAQFQALSADWQVLCVPRRNPESREIRSDQSSLAAKGHFRLGEYEADLMAASHYGGAVFGSGLTGYLGQAAWRTDLVGGSIGEEEGGGGYFSFVANLDYSWVAFDKNWYGLVEVYFNSLGGEDYPVVLADPRVAARLERGEMYTLGRWYLSAEVNLEAHPLVNLYLTAITNLLDPSGSLQPRVVWSALQNLQVTAGANLYWGGEGTEFGGFPLPPSGLDLAPAPQCFLWATWFF